MTRWTLILMFCAPWATPSACGAQQVHEVLFHNLTYWSGPLTVFSETASFLLARYGTQSDSAGHVTNVPKQAIEYLVYRDYAVRYADGKPLGRTPAVHGSRKLMGHLLYPSLTVAAMGAYQVNRYRAAGERISIAERNGLHGIAVRYRKDRERNATYAIISLTAGAIGIALASTTIPVLTLGDGTVITLHPDGRFTAQHGSRTQSIGALFRLNGL